MNQNIVTRIVTRKLDSLGRIAIPREFQRQMQLHYNDLIELKLTNTGIEIQKPVQYCLLCETDQNVIRYKNNFICSKCLRMLKDIELEN